MKLIKRLPYANHYEVTGAFRAVIGGIPNVPDRNGNLDPLDNEPTVITTDPRIGILIPRVGLGQVGFHDKATNKYGSIIRLHTGESLIRRIKNFPAGQPTINKAKRYIQWNAGQQWVREYVTEKHCKQVIKQADGQAFTEVYKLNGLTPKKNGTKIDFLRKGVRAFSIERPYYIDPTTDPQGWLGYVPLTWKKVGDDYELSYPAPDASVLRGGFAYIDPTVTFTDGSNVTNKDSYIIGNFIALTGAGAADISIEDLARYNGLIRFDISTIPSNATVITAVLTLTDDGTGNNPNNTIGAHQITTDWGVTPTDAGATENPATGGQATYRRSFDYNGAGGDVAWAAGNFSAADFNAAEDSVLIGAVAAGTEYNWNIPIMVQNMITTPAANYGIAMIGTVAGPGFRKDFYSLDAALRRPYLTVDYTVPVFKSAIGTGIGIGIGI